MHTWFMQGDWDTLAKVSLSDFPYSVPLAYMELGRGDEGLPKVRELEGRVPTRRRHVVTAARALLEGRIEDSVAAMRAMLSPEFRDRRVDTTWRATWRDGDPEQALAQLEGIIADGFACFPNFARDPWFDALRAKPAFGALLARCEARHRAAVDAFERIGGSAVLA
jgi:hypothetical protein